MARQTFEVGEKVFVKNYKSWEPAIVTGFSESWRRSPKVNVKTKGWAGSGGYDFPRSVPHTRAYIVKWEAGLEEYDAQQRAFEAGRQAEKERAARREKALKSPLIEHATTLRSLAHSREAEASLVNYIQKHFIVKEEA